MVNYDRTNYLQSRPAETLRPASRSLRTVSTCEIDGCTQNTYRLSSAKCRDHRGTCGFSGCGKSSWDDPKNYNPANYPNGKEFRYCPLHKGRLRAQRRLDAEKWKSRREVSLEDDPFNPETFGEWTLSPQGYIVRYVQTISGRSLVQFQHRVVVEEHLGRALESHENIHHRNGWTVDNRIENLEVWNKPQTPGQRVNDKIEWCKNYLAEHGMTVVEVGAWIGADTHIGWKSAPHRVAMARLVGRALYKHEIVSCLDRNTKNLSPENLELWTFLSPKEYTEEAIVSWMLEDFLPQYGFGVVE